MHFHEAISMTVYINTISHSMGLRSFHTNMLFDVHEFLATEQTPFWGYHAQST